MYLGAIFFISNFIAFCSDNMISLYILFNISWKIFLWSSTHWLMNVSYVCEMDMYLPFEAQGSIYIKCAQIFYTPAIIKTFKFISIVFLKLCKWIIFSWKVGLINVRETLRTIKEKSFCRIGVASWTGDLGFSVFSGSLCGLDKASLKLMPTIGIMTFALPSSFFKRIMKCKVSFISPLLWGFLTKQGPFLASMGALPLLLYMLLCVDFFLRKFYMMLFDYFI